MIKLDNEQYIAYERIGEFHSDGVWIHPSRIISSYEVIMVLEGTVYLHEEKREYVLHPGDAIILEPGKLHGGSRSTTENISFFWLHFHTALPLPFKYASGLELYETKQLMKKLLHITNTAGFSENAADALTLLILEELKYQEQEKSIGKSINTSLISEYVRINYDKNLTVNAVATHFGYNPDYITKIFRKHFGVGLKEYIAQQKIKKIKDLLLTTNLSIKLIATELGYSHENLLIKFFLYHEGISPAMFRNQYYRTHLNKK